MRDFKRLQTDPPQGVNGSPNPENIMEWNAVIFGPEDTPWDGGESGGIHRSEISGLSERNLRPSQLHLCAQVGGVHHTSESVNLSAAEVLRRCHNPSIAITTFQHLLVPIWMSVRLLGFAPAGMNSVLGCRPLSQTVSACS